MKDLTRADLTRERESQLEGMHLPMTNDLREVLVASTRLAEEEDSRMVETKHLLLGILARPDSRGVALLADLGIDEDSVRRTLGSLKDMA